VVATHSPPGPRDNGYARSSSMAQN
jgi:hypothetical protein